MLKAKNSLLLKKDGGFKIVEAYESNFGNELSYGFIVTDKGELEGIFKYLRIVFSDGKIGGLDAALANVYLGDKTTKKISI